MVMWSKLGGVESEVVPQAIGTREIPFAARGKEVGSKELFVSITGLPCAMDSRTDKGQFSYHIEGSTVNIDCLIRSSISSEFFRPTKLMFDIPSLEGDKTILVPEEDINEKKAPILLTDPQDIKTPWKKPLYENKQITA